MVKRRANGEGTLRKRADGRWESSVMVGWKEDGRRQIKSFYGKTQEEVRKKVLEWKRKSILPAEDFASKKLLCEPVISHLRYFNSVL
jgi:hypothetical protein